MTHTLADYAFALVGLSFVVALIGALVGLFTSQYVRDEDGEIRLMWTVFCAVIIAGCMMWAAHFTGMLAYQPDVPVTFGLRMTLLSFVMAAIEPLGERSAVAYFEGAITPSDLTLWVMAAAVAVVVIGVILGLMGYLQRQAERRRRESAL
jgi:NO-binding membrane sensor protein with MHYT domain